MTSVTQVLAVFLGVFVGLYALGYGAGYLWALFKTSAEIEL